MKELFRLLAALVLAPMGSVLVLLSAVPYKVGNWMMDVALGRTRRDRGEIRLLRLAQEHHGELTSAEVALHLGLTLNESKARLDALVLQGHARYRIEEGGQFIYCLGQGLPLDLKVPLWQQLLRRFQGMRNSQLEMERQLVRLALERGGRLTAAEVTAHLPLTLDQAKELLDGLSVAGHLGHEVTDDGRIVYRLAEAVEEDQPVTISISPE